MCADAQGGDPGALKLEVLNAELLTSLAIGAQVLVSLQPNGQSLTPDQVGVGCSTQVLSLGEWSGLRRPVTAAAHGCACLSITAGHLCTLDTWTCHGLQSISQLEGRICCVISLFCWACTPYMCLQTFQW